MAILSVGLVAAVRVFPVGLRASRRAEMFSRAAMLAQRSLESLKLSNWNEWAEGETVVSEGGFDIATRIRSVQLEAITDASRLKAVDVTVRWTHQGKLREMACVTYVRRNFASRNF